MWSMKHDSCTNCGTTQIQHKGNGLCRSCYFANYFDQNPSKRQRYEDKRSMKTTHHCPDCGSEISRKATKCRLCAHKGPFSEEHLNNLREAIKVRPPEFGKTISKIRKGNPRFSGENHGNWRGGISFEKYGPEFNIQFKRQIRSRENHCCIMCNDDESTLSERLSVHHVDYDKTNNIPENCVALCRACHTRTNINRKQWLSFFQSILSERYGYEYQGNKVVLTLPEKTI